MFCWFMIWYDCVFMRYLKTVQFNFTGPLTITTLPVLTAAMPGVAGNASKRFAANVGEGAMRSELAKENLFESNKNRHTLKGWL